MTLVTRCGRELDPGNVLPEHPRPQLVRPGWRSLNGWWEYAITTADAAQPVAWDGRILVPFSPEAPLSGVERMLQPGEALWYRLALPPPPQAVDGRAGRVLLHFGACDRHTTAWLDGEPIGEHHDGYLPFSFELTAALRANGPRELVVRVTDPSDTEPGARGKQRLKRGGIWYTPQSGIWQTVWLEAVPDGYIESLRIEPRYEPAVASGAFVVRVDAASTAASGSGQSQDVGAARVRILADGREVAAAEVLPGEQLLLPVSEVRVWSPADPFLYDVEVEFGEDRVTSYAGLRSLGIETAPDGARRFTLNGEPVLHAGLLDQGYWPDGLLTPPSDDAMVADIEAARAAGFSMLRKHIKVEPLRWYHHCDRLGMLVWQDAVNGGGAYRTSAITVPAFLRWWRIDDTHGRGRRALAREDAPDRAAFESSLERMIALLASAPSIIGWVPFNEGWGQFDAARIARRVASLDPSRPVDHASGWHDQGAGDVFSLHIYFRRFRMPARREWRGRAVVLSEFGGYSLPVAGHRSEGPEFGYKRFRDRGSLADAIRRLWRGELAPAVRAGLAGFVYTQLTDVEDEVNGILTYDREVVKIDSALLRELNDELRLAASASAPAAEKRER